MNKSHNRKLIIVATLCFPVILLVLTLSGCGVSGIKSKLSDIKASLIGIPYNIEFYSNDGNKFMEMEGERIDLEANVIEETYVNDNKEMVTGYDISSIITITIDGEQMTNCGSTVLFIEKGLTPDVSFDQTSIGSIESESDSITDITKISSLINRYKNYFGKPTVVLIQSQLGNPICTFSGDDVYWEVSDDIPKTTKLTIDGKTLYIHRANFQIIDKDLLD